MFRKFLIVALSALYLVLSTTSVQASDQFAVDATVTYKVEEHGKTLVTHDITLENLYSAFYATSYTLSLENINAENIKAIDDAGRSISIEQIVDAQKLNIKLTFAEAVLGTGKKRHFLISYENSNFAVKTGEVWEVSIPRLSDNGSFRNYKVHLEIPNSLGEEAYISPQPLESQYLDDRKRYVFSKEIINQTGVTAGFGQFQVFSFNLSYHLSNPNSTNAQTEIALPPDTAFQKVYLSKIDPKPVDVRIDSDGNYLAVYKLKPRQRIDVTVEGSVQIFAGHRPFPIPTDETLQNNLKDSSYWQSDDPKIKALAKNLKTPEAIYSFVAEKLKYDFSRVKPNVTRLGSLGALDNPNQAICMEFTDLFVAIARAAGIPAREVNGYAYTENRELQPLSLVADVLHSWPEYYDKNKMAWIPIDPTWGATSGVDYFNKLDLRHFAFVIHGSDAKEPYPPGSYKLGPNPQKDVFVSFGQLPATRNSVPRISISTDRNIPFLDIIYSVNIYNPGPSTLYSFSTGVYFDKTLHSRDLVQILPPYSTYKSQIKIPYNLLAKNMPDNIKVIVNESQASLSTNKAQVVINSLIVLFSLFIIIVILVMIKLKKIRFEKITAIIAAINARFTRKTDKNTDST